MGCRPEESAPNPQQHKTTAAVGAAVATEERGSQILWRLWLERRQGKTRGGAGANSNANGVRQKEAANGASSDGVRQKKADSASSDGIKAKESDGVTQKATNHHDDVANDDEISTRPVSGIPKQGDTSAKHLTADSLSPTSPRRSGNGLSLSGSLTPPQSPTTYLSTAAATAAAAVVNSDSYDDVFERLATHKPTMTTRYSAAAYWTPLTLITVLQHDSQCVAGFFIISFY